MSDTGKVMLAAAAIIIGLQLYGIWTRQSFTFDPLHPNQVGTAMAKARADLLAQAWKN